jgi:soluble lytic murein transglycosylase-like protein
MRTETIQPAEATRQPTAAEKAKIAKAAQDFEAVFMRQLVSSMRKAGELLGNDEMGEAEKMSMDMAWDGLASQMAKAGGIGIAKMVEPWLAGNPDLLRTLPGEAPRMETTISPFGLSASAADRAYRGSSRMDVSLDELVKRASAATGVDSSLIRGVIQTESAGNPRAESPKGAIGLMQLMPSTAAELGVDPRDPAQNVLGGARYLASLLRRYDGDEKLALAGYNAGPGAVDRHGGIPPYKETRNYVTSVLAHRRRYAEGEP